MNPFELNQPADRANPHQSFNLHSSHARQARTLLPRSAVMGMVNLLIALTLGLTSLISEAGGVRFSLVKTAETRPLDAFSLARSQESQGAVADHVAVLIEHHAATLLFDTSLGRQIDSQFANEMPWYNKPLLKGVEVAPVRDQLERHGVRVDRILLSHVHWHSASGLADFPEVPVWAPYEEIEFSQTGGAPAVLSGQFRHGVKWRPYDFLPRPFMGFEQSHDLFGDGSLVLVPLKGHTPGSVGLFVTLEDGRRFFFPGDIGGLPESAEESPKQRLIRSRMLDHDRAAARSTLARLQQLLSQESALTLVPAHDAIAHEKLGYYPNWTR
nr:MBL fold metallo-hydrolase [Pseudomonas benzenivorans]